MGRVTAVVCAAFDPQTDAAILDVRSRVRSAGITLPDQPPHRPHFSLTAARIERDSLDAVLAMAGEVAARHEPVPIVFTEVGRFGRAGALWLGPAPNRGLPALQKDVYRTLKRAGFEPAFGEQTAPNLWVAHCTLATRVPKPQLRDVQATVAERFDPIRGTVDALATILVGGRGDVAHVRLGARL
ncbi:MAG TPA: 2'-5' RNA ligase family protein [Jatrophihabitantaceae bacterium]|nr:2'-5' RNA ligase family protein [Jatrophihabitantaceae bacterium]